VGREVKMDAIKVTGFVNRYQGTAGVPVGSLNLERDPVEMYAISEFYVEVPASGAVTLDMSSVITVDYKDLIGLMVAQTSGPVEVKFFDADVIVVDGDFVVLSATGTPGIAETSQEVVLTNNALVPVMATVQVGVLPIPAS
jgi:hypothetical protein